MRLQGHTRRCTSRVDVWFFSFTTTTMFSAAASASLLAFAGSAFAAGLNASTVAELTKELRLAPTKVNQFAITTDELSVFDFNAAQKGDIGVTTGTGN